MPRHIRTIPDWSPKSPDVELPQSAKYDPNIPTALIQKANDEGLEVWDAGESSRDPLPPFSIPKERWSAIEAAYGHKIDTDARQKIEQATRIYLDHVEGERASATVHDAVDTIKAEREALRFLYTSLGRSSRVLDGDSLDSFKRRLLNKCYSALYLLTKNDGATPTAATMPLNEFKTQLERWAAAYDMACKELDHKHGQDLRGRKQGETWANWACTIMDICEDANLPITVSKDYKPSTFVKFIAGLEECFPKQLPPQQKGRSLPDRLEAVRKARKAAPSS